MMTVSRFMMVETLRAMLTGTGGRAAVFRATADCPARHYRARVDARPVDDVRRGHAARVHGQVDDARRRVGQIGRRGKVRDDVGQPRYRLGLGVSPGRGGLTTSSYPKNTTLPRSAPAGTLFIA